jgi:HK97 family phage major capsid protein
MELKEALERLEGEFRAAREADTKDVSAERAGSRYVGPGADVEVVEKVAAGGSVEGSESGYRVAERRSSGTKAESGVGFLRQVKAARRGDPRAHEALTAKAWLGSTDSAGGLLVPPQQLPGYLEARRAASPLRERCAHFDVTSNEVWVVTEGNTVTVTHVAEGATKPDTTGTVAQKVSTIHKVAGTSHVSDELLADSNGNAGQLVSRQFAAQIGIQIDTAIISGTGTGQPTGIRNTAGVNAQAVDGQTGQLLYESILRAASRIGQRFEPVDTVVVHPRDALKFGLAKTTTNEYLFPGGIQAALPSEVDLVLDANLPTNLGAGTNESVMIVGGFRRGAYFFSRTPLTIDSSQDAGFATDETVFRGVERYGFAVVVPGAFEVLTGITP